MKKLLALFSAAIFSLSTIYAETQTAQQSNSSQAAHTGKSGKANTKYKENEKKEEKASSPAAKPSGTKKKDGTLDMRYKANKGSNKTTVKKG